VFDFFSILRWAFRKSSIRPEKEVRQVDLIPAILLRDQLAVVEDLKLVILKQVSILEIGTVLAETDVHANRGVLLWLHDDLLFENDSILGWMVLIRVLERLTADDFFKCQ